MCGWPDNICSQEGRALLADTDAILGRAAAWGQKLGSRKWLR